MDELFIVVFVSCSKQKGATMNATDFVTMMMTEMSGLLKQEEFKKYSEFEMMLIGKVVISESVIFALISYISKNVNSQNQDDQKILDDALRVFRSTLVKSIDDFAKIDF